MTETRHAPLSDGPGAAAPRPAKPDVTTFRRVVVLAALTLPLAFAVAELTGVRPIGGAVLAALAAATVLTARAGVARSAAWLAVVAVAFALSHVVADALTTWGAVAAAAAAVTFAAGVMRNP